MLSLTTRRIRQCRRPSVMVVGSASIIRTTAMRQQAFEVLPELEEENHRHHHHRHHHQHRHYSMTQPVLLSSSSSSSTSWWNPFKSSSSTSSRDGSAKVASTPEVRKVSDMRRIQERKDIMVALLATEFRRISNLGDVKTTADENTNTNTSTKSREKYIDMAFQELEKKDLDELTIVQLRHELYTSLQDQLVQLFHAFGIVDANLPPFDPDSDSNDTSNNAASDDNKSEQVVQSSTSDNSTAHLLDTLLKEELEYTMTVLETPAHSAPKGLDPSIFLNIKQGALQTLLDRRHPQQQTSQDTAPGDSSNEEEEEEEANDSSTSTWVEADDFGFHETIDDETNQLVRYYQTINMCRSSKLRNELGYAVIALQSCIPGAGRGVFVDGFAKAGSILAFQPGLVWPKEHLLNIPFEEERELQNNDNYQLSLRPDDHLIDSRKSPYTVLTDKNSNPMALGHVVNHPTPTMPPNCKPIMVNFVIKDLGGGEYSKYIPNTYARPPTLTTMGSLWDRQAVDMHGMCLLATRDVCNEELFYDYRLMTSHLPRWYNPVEDTHFVAAEEVQDLPSSSDSNATTSTTTKGEGTEIGKV